jgi:dipeptidyl aminopeptidase/acylaminoacyl peptidase
MVSTAPGASRRNGVDVDPEARTAEWFAAGGLLTVRPSPGSSGRCLVVEEGGSGPVARIWDPVSDSWSAPLPDGVGTDGLVTPDGRWVIDLDDGGGSEVGALVARTVDGTQRRLLTAGRAPYVLRGLDLSQDGSTVLATIVDEDGHHLLAVPWAEEAAPREIHRSAHESWLGCLSADGSLASVDTTDHNPGVRRPAVTVIDVATSTVVAVLDDLPDGPVRAVRFSPVPGDPRLLVTTERTGQARPAVWDPTTGARVDLDAAEVAGDVLPLDWHPATGRVLAVESVAGAQRLVVLDDRLGTVRLVDDTLGSYAEPDVASVHRHYWQSFFAPDGSVVVVGSSSTTPLHVLRIGPGGDRSVVRPPVRVPAGVPLASQVVTSEDGTPVQFWWARPATEPRGTVVQVHGGPNLVTVDAYDPALQAWLDRGFAVAAVNYRGSVLFGRAFREGFWGSQGDRELADIDAAIGWLRGEGLADPRSTFISGPSYGGHLSLLAAGRLPDRFVGVFATVAMADWESAWPDMNPSLQVAWRSFLAVEDDGTYDPDRVTRVLRRFSSINWVDHVSASVWIHQGERDTRTPPEQARRYAAALAAAGGDVLVDWFDAGHERSGAADGLAAFERVAQLADLALAGRRWSDLSAQRA